MFRIAYLTEILDQKVKSKRFTKWNGLAKICPRYSFNIFRLIHFSFKLAVATFGALFSVKPVLVL